MEYKLATSTWGKEEINAIQEVIDTDKFSMGPKVEEYEKQFALLFGSKYGVMCSSGSTANLLMVASLFFQKTLNYRRVMKLSFRQFHGQLHIFHFNNMV